MKIHRVLCEAVIKALDEIFQQEKYADKVIESLLKSNTKWGSRDRGFIAENTYGIVRYKRWYECILENISKEVNAWTLLGMHLFLENVDLPEWPEFEGIESNEVTSAQVHCGKYIQIKESIPDWLNDRGIEELGFSWPDTIHALNEKAKVVLRTNTLKTTRDALANALEEEDVETREAGTAGLVLEKRKNVFRTKPFKEGWFEVQDYSSQKVAPFLEVEPGMRVVDACAGAGGKSLHMAALMRNKGKIIALDTEEYKLEELSKRAKRAGVHIIETRLIQNNKVIKRLRGSADRLLLDVPCSGLGVLRRNPDAKWKLTPVFIEEVRNIQRDILVKYAEMLKVGGKMVYATCSILPSENSGQVRWFLENSEGKFKFIKEESILPQDEGFDGFYMALLERMA